MNAQFIRYLFVGLGNTIFGYTVFALMVFCGAHYTVALLIATVAGVFFNFKTFGVFVFDKSDWHLISKFIAIYVLLYGVNVSCVFVLMMYIHNVYMANALVLVFVAGLGYKLNRSFVYANN